MNHLTRLLNNRHYELLYNTGVSLLYSKQPLAAFECLHKLTGVYNQNARLWLRLAECCCMCYKHSISVPTLSTDSSSPPSNTFVNFNSTASGNEKIFKLSEKIKCINRSFGQGYHHKIYIGNSLSKEWSGFGGEPLRAADFASPGPNLDPRLISLEFAYMCLRNALSLLPVNEKQLVASLKSDALLKSVY